MARPAQRMGDGAELDWELLYDLYASRLRRVIRRRVSRDAVEDVLQDSFLHAFKSRATIDPARPIYPWLATVAVRTTTEWSRRRLRTLPVGDAAPSDSEEAALDSLDEDLLNRARRVGIKHAFASLNGRQRRLLQLVTVEGLSYERAADIEGISTEAARSAIARARTNFKTSYTEYEQREGLLGVGVVGALLKWVRRRFQHYQAVAAGHLSGVGVTAATVAVVAVAVAPIVHQASSHASEQAPVLHAEASVVIPRPATQGDVAITPTSSGGFSPAMSGPRTAAGEAAPTDVRIGRSGNTGGASFASDITRDGVDSRTWATITVECDVNPVAHVSCIAIDATADLVPN